MGYRQLNGIMIPTKIEASWLPKEGEYSCTRFHVTEFDKSETLD